MRYAQTLAAAAALALLPAVPLLADTVPAQPATADILPAQPMTYDVAFRPVSFGGGEYQGTLVLSAAPGGEVQGEFRFSDVGLYRPITGGVTGTHVWLDLGENYRIEGTLKGGRIEGATTGLGAFDDYTQAYTFSATPETRPQ
jgi:hypothetical protein